MHRDSVKIHMWKMVSLSEQEWRLG